MIRGNSAGPGVYVHWPFCARICPYCDFNVYKNRAIDEDAWIKALRRDLEYYAAYTNGQQLQSLYFGGGTPSLAPLPVIDAVIEMCNQLWGFDQDAEITLEANPTDAEQARFAAFASAGVNRLSLGVQSLRDDALEFLGRNHDAASARNAITAAQTAFDRVTFDLIYARPDQSLDAWRAELTEALSFGAGHMSLYQLTVEPGTAFEKAVERGRWRPADDERAADIFDLTQDMMGAAGRPAYEISNHAAPGAESRHNLIYWTYGDYIGIGPGAHGRLTKNGQRIATETASRPEAYLGGQGRAQSALSDAEATMERLSMGLRLHRGMPFTADDPFFAAPGAQARLSTLIEDELLIWDGALLAATTAGRRLLNRVLYGLFS